MSLPVFPADFPPPLRPESGGESAKHNRKDSTVSSTTDANYTITRARASRKPQTWTYAWKNVSDAAYNALDTFFQQVGMSGMFTFTPWSGPTKGTPSTVRITAKSEWQPYITGWQGSITFEEV